MKLWTINRVLRKLGLVLVLSFKYFQLIIADIKGPMAEMPPTCKHWIRPDEEWQVLGVDWTTKTCPRVSCGDPMKRTENPKGWYCKTCVAFIPDECV